jgi:hypothetical protein
VFLASANQPVSLGPILSAMGLIATTGDAFVRVGAHTRLQGSGAQRLALDGHTVYVGCRPGGLKRSAEGAWDAERLLRLFAGGDTERQPNILGPVPIEVESPEDFYSYQGLTPEAVGRCRSSRTASCS